MRTSKSTAERTELLLIPYIVLFFFNLLHLKENLKFWILQPLEIQFLSLRLHFAADQTKMVRSEPSSATCETQNVNWSYLRLNEAFDILNYVDYTDVSFLQADRILKYVTSIRLLFCFIL